MRKQKQTTLSRTSIRRQQDSHQRSKSGERSKRNSPNGSNEANSQRETGLSSRFNQDAFEQHAAMLSDSRMLQPMYARERTALVQQLQREYGNRYVQRLADHISLQQNDAVQTKLEVGPAGDAYEQEADRVAKQVMGITSSDIEQSTQRQVDDEELMMKPKAQRQVDDEELMMKPKAQRQVEDEELMMKPKVQRRISEDGGEVDSEVEGVIRQAKGGGQAIPDNVRGSMEGAFGADFSGVRVHTGAKSDALNESISARAFTTGQDIFFNKGEYNPGSSSGKEILAHELTHVVQQNGSAVQKDDQDIHRVAELRRQDDNEEGNENDLSAQEEQEWLQAKPKAQRQIDTSIQRAWSGRRQLKPLSFLGKPWVVRKRDNIVNLRLFHEHIFFEDEQNGNIGHMGKNGLGPDNDFGAAAYSRVRENLDDERMRTAVHLAGNPGAYGLLTNNCQDYVQGVMAIYDKLTASAANVMGGPMETND